MNPNISDPSAFAPSGLPQPASGANCNGPLLLEGILYTFSAGALSEYTSDS